LIDAGRVNHVYASYPMPDNSGERFVLDALSYSRAVDFARWTTSFERMGIFSGGRLAVGTGQDARELPVSAVSANFFGFFDAPPALGRYFTAQEDQPPIGAPVAVLSYAMWQTTYGGRADVLGQTLQIGATIYTVIGVATRGFVGLSPDQPPVAFIPFAAYAAMADDRPRDESWWTSDTWNAASVLVRRKPNVTVDAASSDLTAALLRSSFGDLPESKMPYRPFVVAASVISERGPNQTNAARAAALVGGMALIVLLIAAANVANLLLARALRRRREIAVRLAIGVTRGRLLSQLLSESLLLSLLGGLAGLVIAQWGGAALRAVFLPPGTDSPVIADTRTLVFVGIAVVLAGVLTGLAPVWQARRVDLTRSLKTGARDGTTQRSRARVTLLILQSALSVVLLVGAGLFVRSLGNVRQLPLDTTSTPCSW
jgi:predicted permease